MILKSLKNQPVSHSSLMTIQRQIGRCENLPLFDASKQTAIFDRELQRVTDWLQKVNTDLERDAEWFEANLRPYALQERSKDRKSIVLPHGTIKTVSGRVKFDIEDESKFLDWAETNAPELVRVKKEIDKKALGALNQSEDKVISTQGEIVPAVKVVPAEISVSFVIAE